MTLAEKFEDTFFPKEWAGRKDKPPIEIKDYLSWLSTAEAEIRQDERRRVAEWVWKNAETATVPEFGDIEPNNYILREDILSFLTSSKESK